MRVREIFYSLQGEGALAGTPAVFLRFAGCNLACPFCDTDFSGGVTMSEEEIADALAAYPASLVVVTGGEPALQLTASLVERIHRLGKRVSIETNGTRPLPPGIDHVCCSPKEAYIEAAGRPVLTEADEVKVVFDGIHEVSDCGIRAKDYFLQPCDTGDEERNRQITARAVDYCLAHPRWRLSLQLHKLLRIR